MDNHQQQQTKRRLAILSSHFTTTTTTTTTTSLSPSSCGSSSSSTTDKLNDCVFCRIIRGQSPAFKLYEDDVCLCILDVNPLCHGHSLIIPKTHYSCLEATPPALVAAMCSKVPFISNAIMKATGCDSFNLLVNNGVAAGQVVFHTHIHIIPRKSSDCLWNSETLQRFPLIFDQRASQLVEFVRQQLAHLSTPTSQDVKVQVSSFS